MVKGWSKLYTNFVYTMIQWNANYRDQKVCIEATYGDYFWKVSVHFLKLKQPQNELKFATICGYKNFR